MEYKSKKIEPYGFKQLDPIPSQKSLAEFYSQNYYAANPLRLSDEELTYIELETTLSLLTIGNQLCDQTLLDLGCGPGFFANALRAQGWEVHACDYAVDAVRNNNPELLAYFTQCDIENYARSAKLRFSLVNLQNVLEHVRDPVQLLLHVKRLMKPNAVLRVKVPNDYSAFQSFLLEGQNLTQETWVSFPDHINYFNYDSLTQTVLQLGFEVLSVQADFPIEVFLLNSHSNYSKRKELGKEAHMARLRASNYLLKKDISLYKTYSEVAAQLEYGRQLTIYASLPNGGCID